MTAAFSTELSCFGEGGSSSSVQVSWASRAGQDRELGLQTGANPPSLPARDGWAGLAGHRGNGGHILPLMGYLKNM